MTRAKPLPSQAELRELFDYRDGKLYWRQSQSACSTDREAGNQRSDGYVDIMLKQRNYRRHRLVYAYFHGDPGPFRVDHINRKCGDDRIENLRLATLSQNQYNASLRVNNTSGHKGVSWHKAASKWAAYLALPNRQRRHLGLFTSKSDAIAAYRQAALQLHGEFACFS